MDYKRTNPRDLKMPERRSIDQYILTQPVRGHAELDVDDNRSPINFHCAEIFEEPVEYQND